MNTKIPKMVSDFSEQEIREAAERYCALALNLGASDAKAIPSSKVYVEHRARIKCTIPRCPAYGQSANCPRHSLEIQKIRDLVSECKFGVLVKLDLDPSLMVGDDLGEVDKDGKVVATKELTQLLNHHASGHGSRAGGNCAEPVNRRPLELIGGGAKKRLTNKCK